MTTTTTFTLTEEQELLRKTARDFLSSRCGTDVVREVMKESGHSADLWDEVAGMQWPGLTLPEGHGGSGYGFTELSLLLEELGRAVAPIPLLETAVLAATAIRAAGSDDQQSALLSRIAGDGVVATLAWRGDGSLAAAADGDGWRLDGTVGFVPFGHVAELLVVAAEAGGTTALFAVPTDTDGVEARQIDSLDQTRPLAEIRFDGARVDGGARLTGDAAGALDAALTAGAVGLACEQVGAAQRVLEESLSYAKERKQFGRAIGSFQAIKHRLADMLVAIESAKSAAYHAARVLAAGDDEELAIAAPLAASYASEVFERAAGDMIQIHGGIGFTWEHDAHLFFKRAKADKLLLRTPTEHRARLADTLGF